MKAITIPVLVAMALAAACPRTSAQTNLLLGNGGYLRSGYPGYAVYYAPGQGAWYYNTRTHMYYGIGDGPAYAGRPPDYQYASPGYGTNYYGLNRWTTYNRFYGGYGYPSGYYGAYPGYATYGGYAYPGYGGWYYPGYGGYYGGY